jgi:hypothetical protein
MGWGFYVKAQWRCHNAATAVENLGCFGALLDEGKRDEKHSAFLNSYAPQDEGLYDDAAAR